MSYLLNLYLYSHLMNIFKNSQAKFSYPAQRFISPLSTRMHGHILRTLKKGKLCVCPTHEKNLLGLSSIGVVLLRF